MKALLYKGNETLAFCDMPKPNTEDGEQLIKVEAVGICGSDMHAYLGHDSRRPAPLILGHEAAGTVVGGPEDGRRVTINPLVTCGTCHACQTDRENLCPQRQIISMPPREGAFAQYLSMPQRNLVTVPDEIPLAKAALAEPLAVSWHAVRLALSALHPMAERKALILGGGAIGLGAALALHAMNVTETKIVEPNPERRHFLTETCNQNTCEKAHGTYAIVIDAVGIAATRKTASTLTEPGGVIAHIGLGDDDSGLNIRRITLQEISFIGTYTYTANDFRETAAAIFDGRLGSLDWIEQRPLSQGAQALTDLKAGTVAAPKIILDPWA